MSKAGFNRIALMDIIKLPGRFDRKEPILSFAGIGCGKSGMGTTWVVSKVGVGFLPGLQLASIRQIIAGTAFLVYFCQKIYFCPKVRLSSVIILAILNFVMSNGLSTRGVMYIPAGLGSIIGAIFPFWIVIFRFFGENTKPPARSLAGLVVDFQESV
ncbi:MAG: EamA family transporter [Saprospiraceae bacterium]|nr:EamA family transporter [Saprospiraceae bacterium]